MSQTEPVRRRVRMTGTQRKEQILDVARPIFAQKTFDGATIEEVAAAAGVTKPVLYEHFGSKEGLFVAVLEAEQQHFEDAIAVALEGDAKGYLVTLKAGIAAMLDYIEERPDGFRLLSRDSANSDELTSFQTTLSDIADRVSVLLAGPLERRGYNPALGPIFAQALVGLVAMAGQSWLDHPTVTKDELAAQLTNLAWNGLSNLQRTPRINSATAPSTR